MTEILQPQRLVGPGVDRVDGRSKVTGAARYPIDVSYPGLVHARPVRSTVSAGRVTTVGVRDALTMPGVLAVISQREAARLHKAKRDLKRNMLTPPPPPPLQSRQIEYYGQYVALVVAETLQQATDAARAVHVEYASDVARLTPDDVQEAPESNPYHLDLSRGDVAAGLAVADITVDGDFRTSRIAHSPIGLFATVAHWDDGRLTVHDATQNPFHVRDALASMFGIPQDRVRVLVPFVGGAFGAGLRIAPHTILAALAAQIVGRPVKLALTRPEMFTGLGHRPAIVQRLTIGADRSGTLTAIDHEATVAASMGTDLLYPVPSGSASAYDCANVSARDQRVKLTIPPVAHMRAPGEAEGNYALESLLDELATELGIDPVELRLRNHADVHPQTGIPWSSKALRQCYDVGAQRFGWWDRNPAVGSMRDGRWLVGYGMAGVSYGHNQPECQARATLRADGSAYVCSGTTEIGVGTWTVMTQLAAECLGLPLDLVEFGLGDTAMPRAPYVGGSGLTVALGCAVLDACRNLRRTLADHRQAGETDAAVLARLGLDELSADGESAPPPGEMGVQIKSLIVARHGRLARKIVQRSKHPVPAGAFAARFVEVRVDPDLGLVRVHRVVSAIDAGRIVNAKTARSQIIGGTVQAIGMTLLEEVATDPMTGRIANATLGDYLVPAHADIPDMDVVFVGEPDQANPLGIKGVGEVGYVGIPAAIANAVHHATGRRVRRLPITVEHLM